MSPPRSTKAASRWCPSSPSRLAGPSRLLARQVKARIARSPPEDDGTPQALQRSMPSRNGANVASDLMDAIALSPTSNVGDNRRTYHARCQESLRFLAGRLLRRRLSIGGRQVGVSRWVGWGGHRIGLGNTGCGQNLIEQGRLLQILLGRRSLLIAEIVIVVTRPAAHFGGPAVQQRDDGMVRQPTAFCAKIVEDITQPQITHTTR